MPNRRALFWHEHIGGNQFRLRIRTNNPLNNKQWWTFDWRTKTIRAWARRNYALANQRGQGFRINVAATVRQYTGHYTERALWFNGAVRNIRNVGGKCLDVHGNSDTHMRHVIFYNCHNGRNQAWYIDQRGVQWPRQPLSSGQAFQIRSRMSTHKALFRAEHIGGHQYNARIQNHSPWDQRQWWTFDHRTRTIRWFYKRSEVLGHRHNTGFRRNVPASIYRFTGSAAQKLAFWGGSRRNIRDVSGACLDVYRAQNRHNMHVIFYNCHNGLNQAWYIDQKRPHFPGYPLKDGVRFQIKTRMPSKRALFYHEHIGGHQYRLRIQNNDPYNNKQWWVFDRRSRTIRVWSNRKMVMSIQNGGNNWSHSGYAAVVRHFRKNDILQHMRWFNGSVRNIRDMGIRCLDVHGNSDSQHRHVHWYKCHNGRNQGWWIDRKGFNYPKQPIANGVRFQIRSRMATHKSLFWHEHIGSNQFRLRIHWHNPYNSRQWFVFDSRTNTIRAWKKRGFAIANQLNTQFRIGVAATIRPYRGTTYEKIRWYSGARRNIRNNGQKCLDVHGGSNTNNRHVIYWNCHNGLNQAWWIDQRTKSWPSQPLKDGQRFQIRTRMKSGRSLFWHEHIGGHQYRLRIHNHQPWNKRQWWIFDRRTRTIRPEQRRNYAISNQRGPGFKIGVAAVIRQYSRGDHAQMTAFYGGHRRNIRNVPGQCLDVHGGSDSNHRHVTWWTCHNNANQGWTIDTRSTTFPRYPVRDGQRFQIKTQMKSRRALFYHEHIGSSQYRLRIRDNNPYDNKQWWVFDWRTKTIRVAANRRMVISIRQGYTNWMQNSIPAVVRPHRSNDATQMVRWFSGSRRNIRDVGVRCLDVHGASDTHHRHVQWYKCHNNANQGWVYDFKGINYPRQPLNSGVKFQIKSRMTDHRALFWHEHIGGNQFRLRIQDNDPSNNKQWWTFDRRTQTIRAWARRGYCIGNQLGTHFRIGVAATARPYKGLNQDRIRWYNGSRRNLQNNGRKCLDVHGNSNTHHRHVIFWNCHNGANQGWWLDQQGAVYHRPVLGDGVRFQIRSRMSGNRALFWHEHIGNNDYRLRIHNHEPWNNRQWFYFDRRTQTIRAAAKKNWVISNRRGYQMRFGYPAVIGIYQGHMYQKTSFFPGHTRNIRNAARLCLDVHGNSNSNHRHTIWFRCHNGHNQRWFLDRKGVHYPRYPLNNGVRFQIKTIMPSKRAIIWHEHIGHHQYRLRIHNNNPYNIRQWWIFDWRTKTIRSAADRNRVISIQYRGNNWNSNGYAAVARHYRNEALQRMRWFNGSRRNI
jgi:hypothetical protein